MPVGNGFCWNETNSNHERRKALANSSPGLERSDNPGIECQNGTRATLKALMLAPPLFATLSALKSLNGLLPRVLAALQPWAEISERFHR